MRSFSEIDTTSKRASKAAGFAWGVAEEIGKNMRNLEMFFPISSATPQEKPFALVERLTIVSISL